MDRPATAWPWSWARVRARAASVRAVRRARQQLTGFLLRHGRVRAGKKRTLAHRRWLAMQRFEQPAQQIVLEDYIQAMEATQARIERLTGEIEALTPEWSLAPLMQAGPARGDTDPVGRSPA